MTPWKGIIRRIFGLLNYDCSIYTYFPDPIQGPWILLPAVRAVPWPSCNTDNKSYCSENANLISNIKKKKHSPEYPTPVHVAQLRWKIVHELQHDKDIRVVKQPNQRKTGIAYPRLLRYNKHTSWFEWPLYVPSYKSTLGDSSFSKLLNLV